MSEMKERLLAGAKTTDGDVDPEEVLAAASDLSKDRWLSILLQLVNSHRFTKFIEDNYVIQDRIDEEEKTIETVVIENPVATGPQLTSGQLSEIETLIRLSGCKHPNGVFKGIMKILGQEPEDKKLIVSA